MKTCEVKNCPALVDGRSARCELHRLSDTAATLQLSPDSAGRGGSRCVRCQRVFKDDDFVLRQRVSITPSRARPGITSGYAHVKCEPKAPSQRERERERERETRSLIDEA